MKRHDYAIEILIRNYMILLDCEKEHGQCDQWTNKKKNLKVALQILLNDMNFEIGE